VPGSVDSMFQPGTRHFGRVSSIAVEAGLDTFLFERVLDLAIGLDSESWAEECLVAELRVRGGMRGGTR
jgi:hypothetical protein